MDVQLNRRGFGTPARLRWAGVAAAVTMAAVLVASSAALARHYLDAQRAARALPDVTDVQPQPLPTVGQIVEAPGPPPPPDRILLQVPFTTQEPLNNWAQHQESCEAATLFVLISYWRRANDGARSAPRRRSDQSNRLVEA